MKKHATTISDESEKEVLCLVCHSSFIIRSPLLQSIKYCPFCNHPLHVGLSSAFPMSGTTTLGGTATLVKGHIPEAEHIQFSIGQYQVIRKIGSGGMGEVFLAYDTNCGRRIALKRIREDLVSHKQIHNRFLKEARITSQLTHPAIIPIYSIQEEERLAYYTMPFVQGKTLKEIFIIAQQNEKKTFKSETNEWSIPSLIRIFLSVCQAIAYAHSKTVLHRDVKPDNIIVGPYGEVLILDWGLAKLIDPNAVPEDSIEDITSSHPLHELTNVGKVVGTVAYMAPERAMGHPATFQTDIYSLGVILYQILTLRHPFRRGTLKDFRKHMTKEVLVEPAELAPYRDVPPLLSQVALKCLATNIHDRYSSIDELIVHLENYIEGRSEWFKSAQLDINKKGDWEFQETVLMAEHMAITRGTAVSNWVILMISKECYPDNIKIEAKVKIGKNGSGIGFLLSVPEKAERTHVISGYCLWIGSEINPKTKLLRSAVEVLNSPDIFLTCEVEYLIRIERVDHNIHFYINDVLQWSYISHQPLVGTHIGLLCYDADFVIEEFNVFTGNQNVRVNCLAVPDAFLSHKDYTTALSEYRRIGYSFPGRAEGREALFRAGITLLEEGRNSKENLREEKYNDALDEFTKLHLTPAAPLEYLGKALVYQAQDDYEEEIKCFELAFRRYPYHPLLPVLQEQILYRMNESSRFDRNAAYSFILLAARYFPNIEKNNPAKQLLASLVKHWESLYFIKDLSETSSPFQIIIPLAFWLSKPYTLVEIIDEETKEDNPDLQLISNALYSLVELGSNDLVSNKLEQFKEVDWKEEEEAFALITIFEQLLNKDTLSISEPLNNIFYKIENALLHNSGAVVITFCSQLLLLELSSQSRLRIECYLIWAYLLTKNWAEAEHQFQKYSLDQLTEETSLLHFLYGCWLYVSEGKDIALIHFSSVLEVSYPRTWSLFSHYIIDDDKENNLWLNRAFIWEKRQLYRQQILFYQCLNDSEAEQKARVQEKSSYLS